MKVMIILVKANYGFHLFYDIEWGWSGGPPMAVSPLNQVRHVLNYALSVVPKEKI